MPSKFLTEFESRFELTPLQTALVLGIGYSTYAAYRAQTRVLPQYHANQVHLIGVLSKPACRAYIESKLK